MIFCDVCYGCVHRVDIEKEHDSAKSWWAKYHVRYVFGCGAYYNPVLDYPEVHCGCSLSEH